MHVHILKTELAEYVVITDNEMWDWEEFFNDVIPEGNIAKIITTTTLPNGKRRVREFSF